MGRIVAVAAILAFAVSVAAQSSVATLTLTTKPSPLGLGQNLFEVAVKDAKGRPVTNAEVALLMVMPADPKTKHPEMRTEGTLNNVGGGKYNGIAIVTMAGEWDVTVTATPQGQGARAKETALDCISEGARKKMRGRRARVRPTGSARAMSCPIRCSFAPGNLSIRSAKMHAFDEPGFYNVTCDIHATMRATIYVASTPYVGTADERGRFTFDNVVPGTYTLAGFATGSRSRNRRDRRPARRRQPPLASRTSHTSYISDMNVCAEYFSLQVCAFDCRSENRRHRVEFLAFSSKSRASRCGTSFAHAVAEVLEGAHHGNELSGVETCGRRQRAAARASFAGLSTLLEISQTLAAGGESEERAASGARHSRPPSQHHPQHRRAADRQRRHRGRRGRRAAGRESRREVPARRRDHRPRRPEQQADRRAASVARADVPAAHRRSVPSWRARRSATSASRFC